MESVVADDLNFFIQYRTGQYNCQTAFEQGWFAPHPTHSTHNTHLRIFVSDTYLIAGQLRLEFFFSPLTMLHACMHTCIGTASHGFLVLPCQKLPYIPEIKIVRKVKRYLPYLLVSMEGFQLAFRSKKSRGIQPPGHYGMNDPPHTVSLA